MITIGITDCSKYTMYEQWILKATNVRTIKLSPKENNRKDIEQCHGLLLSGGEDVHPRYFQKMEYLQYCHEIDEQRDEFELSVLQKADEMKVPVLGICRGLQVANVYYGGTLIPDIPSFGKFNHSRFPDKDRTHKVIVDGASELFTIVKHSEGEVNSAHHQSAELIGKGLVVNCVSADGIVEGIEWLKREDKPFMQLVQWHPERMNDLTSNFSQRIKEAFVEACRKV